MITYYYIIYIYNLFNLKDNKISYILSLSVLTITLTSYFLLFHRNQYKENLNINTDFYSKSKNKLYEIKDDDNKVSYEFNMTNINNTLLLPILNGIKFFFSYVLIFLIPFIVLAIIFYILQSFQNSFNILNYILGIIIFITTLSIIAYLLKIKMWQFGK